MTQPYSMRIAQHGGSDVFEQIPLELTTPQPNEVRIKHISIGLNFIDTYHRSGLYPVPLPAILGAEAVGTVDAIGADVDHLKLGDIVGYYNTGLGGYATHNTLSADRVFVIPSFIPATKAAAILLKGLTCEYLIKRCFPVQTGQTVLVHAIAGGVGLIACQWLKQLGATVIGTTSTTQKAEIATAHGCDHIIRYDHEDIAQRVMDFTDGAGVPVVFDGVGKSTFEASLDCLQPRGTMVSFGNASGAVDAIAPAILATKGSLYLTRPTLGHYIATPEELQQSADALFTAIQNGVRIDCDTEFNLTDVAHAHETLQARKIIGQAILRP